MNSNKVITITAWKRPEYLKQVIESLSKCYNIGNYTISFSIEPGCDEVIALAKGIEFCKSIVTVNSKVLGVHTNTYESLKRGFDLSDCVIAIEEDTLLAKDCLLYFEHCFNEYRNDQEVHSIAAFGKREKATPDKYHLLLRHRWFLNQVWGTWKDRWEVFKQDWCFDYSKPWKPEYGLNGGGWDWQVNYLHLINKKVSVMPYVARFLNIGEKGLHCNSNMFRKYIQNQEWAGNYSDMNIGTFHEYNMTV